MLMEYAVTESLAIAGIAVSTGWGATGIWTITTPHGEFVTGPQPHSACYEAHTLALQWKLAFI